MSVQSWWLMCVCVVCEIGGLSMLTDCLISLICLIANMHGNCKEKCSKRQASKANAKKKKRKNCKCIKKVRKRQAQRKIAEKAKEQARNSKEKFWRQVKNRHNCTYMSKGNKKYRYSWDKPTNINKTYTGSVTSQLRTLSMSNRGCPGVSIPPFRRILPSDTAIPPILE